MRKVLKSSEIFHFWANQVQNEGRCGNIFFDGKTIYSYGRHFALGKHVTNDKGQNAVLLSTNGYSVSTEKHKNYTRSAVNHLEKIYCPDAEASHRENFQSFLSEIKGHLAGLVRARKPENYINPALHVYDNAKKYAEFFAIELPTEITEIINSVNNGQYKEYLKVQDERIRKENKEREERQLKQAQETLLKWKSGEIYYGHGTINGLSFLRVYKDNVETSQGIKLPLNVAKRVYTSVMGKVQTGGCNECKMKILDYDVKEITGEFLTVGCHTIEMSEINSIAKQLNWIN